ncbi:MAG: sigma-54-dependent transcriptional regulator [Prevotella sp.]|jgi:two-component system NtrC family response regulator
MNTVLIIDDERSIRMLLCRMLELEGYKVFEAKDRKSGLDAMTKNKVDVVLCDVFLPDGNGVDMIAELLAADDKAKVILLTAHGTISDGVQAIKNGAFDYIVKGDDNRKIIPIINRAMDAVAAERRTDGKAKASLQDERHVSSFDDIIGKSGSLQRVVDLAQKVAATDVPVLLTGETGTGKEVFAQAIHHAGSRGDKPFVAINCSAFSRELLESELFGHKAGAFTGAVKDKKGLFEEADHGTIFLDEIGEMAIELQAKLLRVLEMGEFIKVGDTKPTKVDVRIISATNRVLKDEMNRGRFREDLFFRLSVFQIDLPALRERKEDIPDLVHCFIGRLGQKIGKTATSITPDCLELMQHYPWPGNIRELQNVIERALIVCDEKISADCLPMELLAGNNDEESGKTPFDLSVMERNHIIRVLKFTKGNKTETARLLKIGLTTLYRKIDEYHIVMD